MTDLDFDTALVASAFTLAAGSGWRAVSVASAAIEANLDPDRARARFAGRDAILLRFGRLADEAALAGIPADAPPRERLFDALMRRIDVLQAHRAGVLALLDGLPRDPVLALLLAVATEQSMAALLEGAGVASSGLAGALRTKGLTAVWVYALRAWRADASADLSQTMAALDRALTRAEQAGRWLEGRVVQESGPKPFPEAPVGEEAAAI